ncbi:MAG: FIST C-terminal domain-containing protein [Deltaproteobacteria bacterium]|nr:FIST C-terminal domain-containing protein [Deltaproteobacteria bacterium]
MRLEQNVWTADQQWQPELSAELGNKAQLIILFGARDALAGDKRWQDDLRQAYPDARLFGCSTAGEISGTRVLDDSIVATAVAFEHTRIATAQVTLTGPGDSHAAGEELAKKIPSEGLAHVFILSSGLNVNGSDLVHGLRSNLPPAVQVTGGLAGDGARFEQTFVVGNDGVQEDGTIAALAFYGDRLKIGFGSLGGWDPFGPERLITRSEGNVLFELDGKPALDLYKTYLGEHAANLPAAGLLFPLSIRRSDGDTPLVRTILAVDEETNSLTFAGDLPTGSSARLMKANFDRLIDGAAGAARTSYEMTGSGQPDLAILISCVGRKLVLKQRTEEEVEGVREVLGPRPMLTGFYSYGEICPTNPHASCELHNQTMTITTFSERVE